MMKKRILITLTAFTLITATSIITSCATQKDFVRPANYTLKTEVLTIPQGQIQGIYNQDQTVQLFAGVPYAKPPVGDLRWKEPQDPEPWEGVFSADHFAPEAMQTHSKLVSIIWNNYYHPQKSRTTDCPSSEDCLYLNIWKPETEKKDLPVLVYIHGGSFCNGQSFFEEIDGENMAKRDIIVVTIAYRVNVFGFFALQELMDESPNHTTGNYGLLDMAKALEWVNKNISYFGGNPNNVTIAGESAGSSAVSTMCASPLTKDYFNRAIGESSSVIVENPKHSFRSLETALKMGEDIKKEFKAKNLADLRKIPAEKLVKTKFTNNSCTVDGYVLPQTPYEIYKQGLNHEEALLNGYNLHESYAWMVFTKINTKNYEQLLQTAFPKNWESVKKLYPATTNQEAKDYYTDIFTTVCFSYPHHVWTEFVSSQNKPTYMYCFTKQNRQYKDHHTGEIMYAYDNIPLDSKNHDESDFILEKQMSTYWENFIKTGNPNGPNLPEWMPYTENQKQLINFDTTLKMIDDPFNNLYEFVE